MNEVTPGKFTKKTILVNSRAEAVENAVKIARAYIAAALLSRHLEK
jgi:4-aminobutyrate aminotransferase/(S)-3-amino-2-methylpropionate transaminase